MAGCVLALSIGSYWFIRTNLIRYIFTEADDSYYYSTPARSRVGYYDCQTVLGLANKNVGPNGEEPVLTEEQSAECKVELEKEAVLQKERRYQNDMLSSTLMILIASVVLTIHLKLVKPR